MIFGKPKTDEPMDKDKAQKMLERLGIATKPLDARQVDIRTGDGIVRITKPDVLITRMFGRDVYQISGEVKDYKFPSEAQIKKAMTKTGAKRSEIELKLAELNYDLAKAVETMQGKRKSKKK